MFKLISGVSPCPPTWRHFAAAFVLAGCSLGSAASSTSSGFTNQQAQQGVGVYSANCSSCHGSTLKGVSAPALIGSKFASSITNRFTTAGKLFDYVSSQMPVNNPGSLSKAQYQQVVAFVLAQNGYAPSPAMAQLNAVKLTPYPVAAQGAQKPGATNLEIQNSGTTSTVVTGTLPTATSVNVTNQMMLGAAQNDSDWLLHGRDYTNQRYSALTQINVDTVKALAPVALVQTSMTGSFETTPIVAGGVMYATTPVVDNKMKVLAINAATGESLWQTNYSLGDHKICCGPVNRGLALGYGMVYFVTLDDHLVAFDAANGSLKWSSQVADFSTGHLGLEGVPEGL
jgi:alcohol dehydrogenase (cytochrome c)